MLISDTNNRDHIINLIRNYKSQSKQKEILLELSSSDRKNLLSILADLLQDSDLDLRDSAIKVLMKIDPMHGVDIITPSLHDPIESWRWYVCGALADYGNVRSVLPLVQVLLNDQDSDVRYAAVLALEKIGDRRAIAALEYVQENDRGTDYEGRRIDILASEAIQAIINRETT